MFLGKAISLLEAVLGELIINGRRPKIKKFWGKPPGAAAPGRALGDIRAKLEAELALPITILNLAVYR
jgi:hypothetical protein